MAGAPALLVRSFLTLSNLSPSCSPLLRSLPLPPSTNAPLGLRSFFTSARSFAPFSSSSSIAGIALRPRLNLGWGFTERSTVVKVRAGKTAMACTKRSKSRLSRARTSGYRARLQTPGGRNVLKRRRAKGRKELCPCSNPNSGKRA